MPVTLTDSALVRSLLSPTLSFSVLHDMSLNTVPADILLEIADYFSCPSEVFNLYLTVRPFYFCPTYTYLPAQPAEIEKNK
jgi:hypothetical protein